MHYIYNNKTGKNEMRQLSHRKQNEIATYLQLIQIYAET